MKVYTPRTYTWKPRTKARAIACSQMDQIIPEDSTKQLKRVRTDQVSEIRRYPFQTGKIRKNLKKSERTTEY